MSRKVLSKHSFARLHSQVDVGGETESTTNHILELSLIDQTIVRAYIRNILCFPFLEDADPSIAVARLKEGLQDTLTNMPYLAGTIGPATRTLHPKGGLELTYAKPVPDVLRSGRLSVKCLDRSVFPLSYQELKDRGMPPSKLRGEIFASLPDAADPTRPAQVLGVQVTFIQGGLMLCVYLHHAVGDGGTMGQFIQRFADGVRLRTTTENKGNACDFLKSFLCTHVRFHFPVLCASDDPDVDGDLDDLSIIRRSLGNGVKANADFKRCPEFKRLDSNSTKHAPNQDPELVPTTGRVFSFHAKVICKLKCLLNARLQNAPAGLYEHSWVSTMDCIAALVWIYVTRARSPHLNSDLMSRFGIVVNIRTKVEPPLPLDYAGNAALYNVAELPISTLIDDGSIIDSILRAACKIRIAIQNVNATYVHQRLALFASLIDFRGITMGLDFDHGNDLFFTSWANFGADADFRIPGTVSGNPEWIRKPWSAQDGGNIVLPRRSKVPEAESEPPWEVLIQLRVDDMERICSDGNLMEWAYQWVE